MSYAPWIVALVGILVAWLLRRELAMGERRETQAMWEAQLQSIEGQRDQRKVLVEAKERRIAKLESEIQRYGTDLDQFRRKVAERELELRDLEEATKHHQEAHRQTSRRVIELVEKTEALEQERNRYKQESVDNESENHLFREMLSTAEIALLERERTIEELESRPRAVPLSVSTSAGRRRKDGPLPAIDPLLELLDLEEEFTPRGTPVPKLDDLIDSAPAMHDNSGKVDTGEVAEGKVAHGDTRPVATRIESADDLTRIKGIGPAFARRLGALGVTRFAQIADWSDLDIESTASAIELSPNRIRKQGWVDSAQALL